MSENHRNTIHGCLQSVVNTNPETTPDKLLEMKDKEAISDLKELFQTADLVKFAKHDPQMNENDANLINDYWYCLLVFL